MVCIEYFSQFITTYCADGNRGACNEWAVPHCTPKRRLGETACNVLDSLVFILVLQQRLRQVDYSYLCTSPVVRASRPPRLPPPARGLTWAFVVCWAARACLFFVFCGSAHTVFFVVSLCQVTTGVVLQLLRQMSGSYNRIFYAVFWLFGYSCVIV